MTTPTLVSHQSTDDLQGGLALAHKKRISAADIAVSHAAANAALEGQELDDDWHRTLRRIATGETSADDVIAAEIRRIDPSA